MHRNDIKRLQVRSTERVELKPKESVKTTTKDTNGFVRIDPRFLANI